MNQPCQNEPTDADFGGRKSRTSNNYNLTTIRLFLLAPMGAAVRVKAFVSGLISKNLAERGEFNRHPLPTLKNTG